MYKLYTIDNTKKSNIKGLWLNKGKVYFDNVFIKSYSKEYKLIQGIKKLFNKKELAVFYTCNGKGNILSNTYELTVLNKMRQNYRQKLSIKEIKSLLNKYNGLTIYKQERGYILEVFYN